MRYSCFAKLLSGVSIFFIFVSSSQVQAIEYGGFGGRPAYPRAENPRTESIFVHTLEPGAVQKEGVLVVNNTAERKTILVYAVNSTASTGGAFACDQLSAGQQGVGAWMTLEKSEVTLEPKTNEIVDFTLRVPKNASAGEHNGCIVTQEKLKPVAGGSGAHLSFRTGLRVAITVPGDLNRKLEIAGFGITKRQDGGYLLQPRVKNLGNVSIDADVKVVTRYLFGQELFRHGGTYPILRGETSNWNFELKKPFWGGWYRANFDVEYDENAEAGVGIKSGKTLTRLEGPSLWFFSFPAPTALAIEFAVLALVMACAFLVWLSRRRKKWIEKNWVIYEVNSGEDIISLAERFAVSWKLLVKVNKLKPPYALKPGQTIKVPPFV